MPIEEVMMLMIVQALCSLGSRAYQKSARMKVCTISDSSTMIGQMPEPRACTAGPA